MNGRKDAELKLKDVMESSFYLARIPIMQVELGLR